MLRLKLPFLLALTLVILTWSACSSVKDQGDSLSMINNGYKLAMDKETG